MASHVYSSKPAKTTKQTPATRSLGRSAWPGRTSEAPWVQAKLEVGAPDDAYEREADAVAERIMRMPVSPPDGNGGVPEPIAMLRTPGAAPVRSLWGREVTSAGAGGRLRRACSECEEVREERLQRVVDPSCHHSLANVRVYPAEAMPALAARSLAQRQIHGAATMERGSVGADQRHAISSLGEAPGVAARIQALRGGGRPLPEATRRFFEPRFGADFSQVRVHAHREAAELAHTLDARAFTVGRDLVFGSEQYAPNTNEGKRLLAHELTHFIQQGGVGETADSAGRDVAIARSPRDRIMREGFESTIEICHRVLTSRKFEVKQGGVRVVLLLEELDESVPNCRDFDFGVTLTKEVDWWMDQEIGTCEASTGGPRSFQFGNLSAGTYYLTIWRNFDHPYCCLSGDILVFDETVASDSSGCRRKEQMSALEIVHTALGLAGFIPALGAIPDGIDALIYAAEGDWTNAGISVVAMVPAFGDGAKVAIKGGKEVIEASGRTIVKMGEEELASGLRAARRAEAEAAERAAKEAGESADQAAIREGAGGTAAEIPVRGGAEETGEQIATMGGAPKALQPGRPGSVIPGGLARHEVAFANEIVSYRGGFFEGVARRSAPGIDGFLDGVAVSLKETRGKLGAVLRKASEAESQASRAGYSGVELFIKAPNVGEAQLLDFARKGPLVEIPNQGTISSITVFTRDGVVRLLGVR